MRLEAKKYLHDVRQSAERILRFTDGKTFADYQGHEMMRAAVERQFEIIGEALAQLARLEPGVVDRIPDGRRIIAFRNVLIHGYAAVDDRLVFGVVSGGLRPLLQRVEALLAE